MQRREEKPLPLPHSVARSCPILRPHCHRNVRFRLPLSGHTAAHRQVLVLYLALQLFLSTTFPLYYASIFSVSSFLPLLRSRTFQCFVCLSLRLSLSRLPFLLVCCTRSFLKQIANLDSGLLVLLLLCFFWGAGG